MGRSNFAASLEDPYHLNHGVTAMSLLFFFKGFSSLSIRHSPFILGWKIEAELDSFLLVS